MTDCREAGAKNKTGRQFVRMDVAGGLCEIVMMGTYERAWRGAVGGFWMADRDDEQ